MAQIDDIVGSVMKYLKDNDLEGDTIIGFTTDNGAENFTWPDGGQTPFAGGKGTALEGGFRVPMIVRWPGKVPAGKVENGIMSGMDWFPTFVAAAGNPNITDELLKGKQLGDKSYKVHLDGYNQMDLITGKGPSARHEIFYFTEGTLSAVRINDFKYRFTDQPHGWLGGTVKVDWPILTNLRLDPFERTGMPQGANGSLAFYNWFVFEFWRFQFVQQEVAKVAQTRDRVPADAAGRQLQPRSRQGADREGPRPRTASRSRHSAIHCHAALFACDREHRGVFFCRGEFLTAFHDPPGSRSEFLPQEGLSRIGIPMCVPDELDRHRRGLGADAQRAQPKRAAGNPFHAPGNEPEQVRLAGDHEHLQNLGHLQGYTQVHALPLPQPRNRMLTFDAGSQCHEIALAQRAHRRRPTQRRVALARHRHHDVFEQHRRLELIAVGFDPVDRRIDPAIA